MSTIDILSEDPEVQTLKGFIHCLQHFRKKNYTTVHLKIIIAVEMLCLVMKGRGYPQAREIASQIGLKPAQFDSELQELVEARYLHAEIPLYGELDQTTYRIGAMGGSMFKRMLRR